MTTCGEAITLLSGFLPCEACDRPSYFVILLWKWFLSLELFWLLGFGFAPVLGQHSSDSDYATKPSLFIGLFLAYYLAGLLIFISLVGLVLLVFWLRGSRTPASVESVEKPNPYPIGDMLQGDRNLATSAQRYHFAHQKQQMMTQVASEDVNETCTEAVTEDSAKETVYECAGFSMSNSREVENPVYRAPSITPPEDEGHLEDRSAE